MSERILSQPNALDKALRRGFAFLVDGSPTGELVKVTIYDLDNEPFTTVYGLLPNAQEVINQAAELACEIRTGGHADD